MSRVTGAPRPSDANRGSSTPTLVAPPPSLRSSWDSFVPARRFQSLLVTLAALTGGLGLVATCLRVFAPTEDVAAMFASFIPYGAPAYLLSCLFFLVALLRARKRRALAMLATASATLLACHLAWLAPLFISDHRVATTPTFTVLSLNTKHGTADPGQLAQLAERADMVVLLEATTEGIGRLQGLGWNERFPYSAGEATSELGGTVLYSRFPLSQQAAIPQSNFQQWITTADVPQLGPVRIIAAHPCNPFCGSNQFRSEHQRLRATADANLNQPLIIAGDLNAVDDHAPLRLLRRDGLESATDILGAGWMPTYPANSIVPPLLPIDHILVNHFLTATSMARVKVADTDHLGLIAQIARAE